MEEKKKFLKKLSDEQRERLGLVVTAVTTCAIALLIGCIAAWIIQSCIDAGII